MKFPFWLIADVRLSQEAIRVALESNGECTALIEGIQFIYVNLRDGFSDYYRIFFCSYTIVAMSMNNYDNIGYIFPTT